VIVDCDVLMWDLMVVSKVFMSSEGVQPLVTYRFEKLDIGRVRYSIRSLTIHVQLARRFWLMVG
jgi:hypothetical protein